MAVSPLSFNGQILPKPLLYLLWIILTASKCHHTVYFLPNSPSKLKEQGIRLGNLLILSMTYHPAENEGHCRHRYLLPIFSPSILTPDFSVLATSPPFWFCHTSVLLLPRKLCICDSLHPEQSFLNYFMTIPSLHSGSSSDVTTLGRSTLPIYQKLSSHQPSAPSFNRPTSFSSLSLAHIS
jgi:hypothetical protein